MKKSFFIIFLGIFLFFSFFTKSSVSAATYMPAICDAAFVDSQGENYSADDWCTDCPDGPYNFCNGGMQYHFGCVSDGIFNMYCSCDHNSAWYEDCSGTSYVCTNWNCTKGSSCYGGLCTIAPTCSWQSGFCGTPCASTQKKQTCGPTGCTGGACTSGQTQCVADSSCQPPPQACVWQSGSCGAPCASNQKQQTCGPAFCVGGACQNGQVQCVADSSCAVGGCPSGQYKPHKQCIGTQCASINTCGTDSCTTPTSCSTTQTCSWQNGGCGSSAGCSNAAIPRKQTCGPTGCTGGACTSGQTQCIADSSCSTTQTCSWQNGGCGSSAGCSNTAIPRKQTCGPTSCTGGTCIAGLTQCIADASCSTSQRCGNGQLDSGEQCDGINLNNSTCQSLALGFTGGTLRCKSDCTFDTSSCTTAPLVANCPSLDGLTTSGITISGFAWNENAKQAGQCQFEWNGRVIPGFPSMASNIAIPYEWMVAAGFPSKLTAANPSQVRDVLDEWHQLSFINNRLKYRAEYGADHPKLGDILSILSSPTGGICSGSGICDLIKKLIDDEPHKALDLKLVIHSYNELKLHRAMTECVLAGRCLPHTYGSWGYLLLGKCPLWKGADATPENCYWPE